MKLENSELGLTIVIEESLIKELKKYAKKFYPNEFGGLLIGRYSEDKKNVIIGNTILPTNFSSSRYVFARKSENLRESINKYFEETPSKIYVGEWHTHPECSCLPSRTDLKALEEIVRHDEVFIENPIMLIISIVNDVFDFCFYVYFNKKVYKYEVFSS